MGKLSQATCVFMVGVKGAAMSGLARILTQMGKTVLGSDTSESQITDDILTQTGVNIVALDAPLPPDVSLVVYSGAHGGVESAQVKEAVAKDIAVTSQAGLIAELIALFPISIAICGTHGKTGTTAITAYTLLQLGAKVSYLVGAPYFKGISNIKFPRKVPMSTWNKRDPRYCNPPSAETVSGQKTNRIQSSGDKKNEGIMFPGGHYEKDSTIFVFEADEYGVAPPKDKTPKILIYYPTHIICTAIDYDHPDMFADLQSVKDVFHTFFTHSQNVYQCESRNLAENRLGVIACLRDLGYDAVEIETVMAGFLGTARRMEVHGEKNGILCIDDYGHHPAEIAVTIKEIRKKYPNRRLVVAFQSHTYSRTIKLKTQFVEALAAADVALIDSVFPSARESGDIPAITAYDLEKLAKDKGYSNIKGFSDRNDLVVYAKTILKKGDVFLTLGAGDIYKIISKFKI